MISSDICPAQNRKNNHYCVDFEIEGQGHTQYHGRSSRKCSSLTFDLRPIFIANHIPQIGGHVKT